MRRVYINLAIALLFLAGFVASAHLTRDLDAAGFANSAWNATIMGMFHAFIAVLHLYNALNCYREYREYRDNHLPQEHDDFDEKPDDICESADSYESALFRRVKSYVQLILAREYLSLVPEEDRHKLCSLEEAEDYGQLLYRLEQLVGVASQTIFDKAESIAEHGFRETPVVDENGNKVSGLFWTE